MLGRVKKTITVRKGSRKKVQMEKGSNEPKFMFMLKIMKLKYFRFKGKGLNESDIMLSLFFLRLD